MRTFPLPPDASCLMSSIRHIGYEFATAIADIIDNSLDAKASNVSIGFAASPKPYLFILDDGEGMSEQELLNAMRYGARHPDAQRSISDLGRYGLGLKTASLSQCRTLTVVSKKDGQLACCRWSLDYVCDHSDKAWPVQIFEAGEAEVEQLEGVGELKAMEKGTLVHWADIDFGGGREKSDFDEQMEGALEHVGLVFHRFLRGEQSVEKVQITANGLPIEPLDPFLQYTPGIRGESRGKQTLKFGGGKIELEAFILPYDITMTFDQKAKLGRKKGLNRGQGFYIYRNKRLLTQGGWFGIKAQGELFKYARIRVDISNVDDEQWSLDVKKSVAIPPKFVRDTLGKYVERVMGMSATRIKTRATGKKTAGPQEPQLWNILSTNEQEVNLHINRVFPAIDKMLKANPALDALFELLEKTIPVESIYYARSSEQTIDNALPISQEQALACMKLLLDQESPGKHRKALFESLLLCDPFCVHQAYLKEELHKDIYESP